MSWKPETEAGKKCDTFARDLIRGLPKELEVVERDEVVRVLNALLNFVNQKGMKVIDEKIT